jgi:hypothetical protein
MTVAVIHARVISQTIVRGYSWLLLACVWAWEWLQPSLTEGCGGGRDVREGAVSTQWWWRSELVTTHLENISHPFRRGGGTCVIAGIVVTEVCRDLDGEI